MAVELDHLFICVARGAPEAERLIQFGFTEGPRNVHPGQGTANRRFFFHNGMLELLWVENPAEAQSDSTAPSQLWQRWSNRSSGACPFGVILRPAAPESASVPFAARKFRPQWLPPDLTIYVADVGLDEPMWAFMPFLERRRQRQELITHSNGAREMTRVTLTTPAPLRSAPDDVIAVQPGPGHLMTIEFDHGSRHTALDARPHLPLIIQL